MLARCLVLLFVIGCGGSAKQTGSGAPGGGGAPDIAAMRTLLERYSPTGSWIVTTFEALPTEFKIGPVSITTSNTGGFATYFRDSAPEQIASQLQTSVHEVYHALASRLAYKLQIDQHAAEPFDSEAFWTGGAPSLVRYSAHFPARELDVTYPTDARAYRYETYISPSSDNQSTQVNGAFGLLDEWTAYLQGGRLIVELWPWVRDEAPRTREVYVSYRSLFHGLDEPYIEFKLFLLHYLLHAREHRPDVYQALVANESFCRAFIAADDAWRELLARARTLESAVAEIAHERGAGSTTFLRDPEYAAIQRHLDSEPYQRVLADLRGR